MHRFFIPNQLLTTDEVVLPPDVAHQVTRVLRLRVGQRIVLFGGDGAEVDAVLGDIAGKSVTVTLGERRHPQVELTRPLHLGVAALKGEKLDWTIQKLTEIGAASITLMTTERTISTAGEERWSKRLERYQRIAREAAEQCGGVRVPEVHEPRRMAELLEQSGTGLQCLILDPLASTPLGASLPPAPGGVLLLIGPEGGFAPEEVRMAEEWGAARVRLGRRVLRAETAAIAAAVIAANYDDASR